VLGLAGCPGVAGAQTPSVPASAWTVYHHDPAGSGTAAAAGSVDTSRRSWTSPALDGQLYGEPLIAGGRVYVATEDDTVVALSATTGAVTWATHLATPVPASSLPCGDISPTVGVTGTPVLDPARGELFVVDDALVAGRPSHRLVGLDAASGRVESTTDVDPSGADPAAILQRTGLNLSDGQVVFGFGGNDGDCSTYRGWVVAVGEDGGAPRDFAVDSGPGESQGAIWMGGAAPTVDAEGDIWVSAGNGSVTSPGHPYDHSDSVLELSPALQLLQFFAPTTWASDNLADRDFSMAPALLPGDRVMIAGKSRIAFLLDGARLGGIGGQLAELASVCSQDVEGGAAVVGTTVYLPCQSGTVAVRSTASPPGVRLLWSSRVGGGPPIVAAGLIWTIGQDGTLSGLDPVTGVVRQQASIGAPANHFPTPSAGGGLLVAPSSDRVVAFRAPAPGSPTTETTGAGGHRPPAPVDGDGGPSGSVLAGIVVGGLAIVGGTGWLVWRRRRRSSSPPVPTRG
jgi:outer membrane protein assembly factor BamB